MGEDTTISYEQWEQTVPAQYANNAGQCNPGSSAYSLPIVDIGAAKYLKDVTVGYTDKPVCIYNGEIVQARTLKISTAEQLQEFKRTLLATGEQIILYYPLWNPGGLAYVVMDPETWQPKVLDLPQILNGFWLLRYAIIAKK
jgi:hypothetical protein